MREKIQKLERVISDEASSDNEKNTARKILRAYQKKEDKTKTVKVNYRPFYTTTTQKTAKSVYDGTSAVVAGTIWTYRAIVPIIDKVCVTVSIHIMDTVGKVGMFCRDWLIEYSRKRGYRQIEQYEQKYTDDILLLITFSIPSTVKMTYPTLRVLPYLSHMSKRQIYRIIELSKKDKVEKLELYKRVFSA